jgi:hypothetical protein
MRSKRLVAEPFLFQLIHQLFQAEEKESDEMQPVSDREFYSIMGVIIVALVVLKIIFHRLLL